MKRFKNIIYINEPNVDQASAVARAVSLAKNNRADLTFVDIIPTKVVATGIDLPLGGRPDSKNLRFTEESHQRKALESMVQPFLEGLQVRVDILVGKTFLEAIRAVLKNGHDLLIKPAENPSWTHRFFGSDDLHLLRKCPCPVWLMKPPEKSNYRSILAAVNFDSLSPNPSEDELNREILGLAASLALSDAASLHIAHAWEALAKGMLVSRGGLSSEVLSTYVGREQERSRKGLHRLAEQLRGWIGKEAYESLLPGLHLPEGVAMKVIPPLAKGLGADLVVMGTVARTGISGLIIGNTAEAILDQLTCSVLAIKPPGFETPVKVDS